MTNDKDQQSMTGPDLAALLDDNLESFWEHAYENASQPYQRTVERFITKLIEFCRGQVPVRPAHPWRMRQAFLEHMQEARGQQPYADSYQCPHARHVRKFLRWYTKQASAGKVRFGELPEKTLRAYWQKRPRVSTHHAKILRVHLASLAVFLEKRAMLGASMRVDGLVDEYFEHRRLARRGKGYGRSKIILADQVTRRYLAWLERHGHLPAGTARGAEYVHAGRRVERGPEETVAFFASKIDPGLPDGLRGPALEYLEHVVYDRQLSNGSLYCIANAVDRLCLCMDDEGIDSFEGLKVAHLDAVVSALISAPAHELLLRRRQVQRQNSALRCFVRFLQERGVVKKDLAAALISPPCYRASAPPRIVSEQQVASLLDSFDRSCAKGRRDYAILMLITTYGLRPGDVSRLKLDDIDWRNETISLVQGKTKRVLMLPLVAEVARAIYEYLRFDRDLQVTRRQVFLALSWPHEPLSHFRVGKLVIQSLGRAGIESVSARNLRASVVTHLLRQGQPLCTIQQVVGHGGKYATDTTQRYAAIDTQLLRRVLDKEER